VTGYYLATGTGSGTYYRNPIWDAWMVSGTTGAGFPITTTASTRVWDGWATTSAYQPTYTAPSFWPQWTAAETFRPQRPFAADRRRWEIQQRRIAVGRLRKRVADRQAEKLLMEHLDDEQRTDWLRNEAFDVRVPSGRTYRIRRGVAGNVYRTHDSLGRFTRRRYCCHIDTSLAPTCDNVLTQKLLLEADEDEFLRLANPA